MLPERRQTWASPDREPRLRAAVNLWRRSGAVHEFPVRGHSMWPLIRDGDRVLVSHGRQGIGEGDVVVFWQNARPTAHRILRVPRGPEDQVFLAKGDHSPQLDPPVHAAHIIGRVTEIRHGHQTRRLSSIGWRAYGRLLVFLVGPSAARSAPPSRSFGNQTPADPGGSVGGIRAALSQLLCRVVGRLCGESPSPTDPTPDAPAEPQPHPTS